ncbi:MAG: alcohol dehydrogenase catalytic domain-containing protein [Nanoarchaeota archaeon]
MKAAILEGIKKITIQDVPKPTIKEGTLLLRVESCSICGSDVRIYNHGNPRVTYPTIIGHEIAGTIEDVGKGVRRWKKGERICLGADIPCGECDWCLNGMANCCDTNLAMGYQFSGGFAQYCLLEPVMVKYGPIQTFPSTLSFDEAALSEPLACCLNGFELANMKPGKSVLIIGAGPIGCMLASLARVLGSPQIILADTNEARLDIARAFSADHYINSATSDLKKEVMDITGQRGTDIIFTACPSVEVHELAVELVAKRGTINLFGGLSKDTRPMQLQSNTLHYKEASIFGSHGSTPRHHAIATKLLASRKIILDALITHRLPLAQIETALGLVKDAKAMKVVIKPNA